MPRRRRDGVGIGRVGLGAVAPAPAYPVDGLVGDDAVGPPPETGGVGQPPDAPYDGDPDLLEDLPGSVLASRESEGVSPQPLLPPADEHVEGLRVAVLAPHDEQFIDDVLGRAFHGSLILVDWDGGWVRFFSARPPGVRSAAY